MCCQKVWPFICSSRSNIRHEFRNQSATNRIIISCVRVEKCWKSFHCDWKIMLVSIDDSHKRKSYWISLRADPFSFCTTVRMSVVGFFLFFSRCFHLESNRNRLRCAQSVQKIYRKFTIKLHFQWLMLSIFVCFLAIFRCFSSYQRPQ